MIPSKQAKMQIQDFNNIISSIYNKITINKAQPKSYTYRNILSEFYEVEKLGVCSDLVFIFKTNVNGDSNFAFNFDYINKNESEYRIKVSFKPVHFDYVKNNKNFSKFSKSKLNDKTIYSDDFSVDVFKEKLTLLNKELKSNTVDKETVLSLINKHFFDNKINIEKEVKRGQKYYKDLINGDIRKV